MTPVVADLQRERRGGFGYHQRWGSERGRGERMGVLSTTGEHEERESRTEHQTKGSHSHKSSLARNGQAERIRPPTTGTHIAPSEGDGYTVSAGTVLALHPDDPRGAPL